MGDEAGCAIPASLSAGIGFLGTSLSQASRLEISIKRQTSIMYDHLSGNERTVICCQEECKAHEIFR